MIFDQLPTALFQVFSYLVWYSHICAERGF